MSRLLSPEDDSIVHIHDQLAHLTNSLPVFSSQQTLTREQIATLIETTFWASLRLNEGRPTRFCVVIAAPGKVRDAIAFTTAVAYDEAQIVKLAPAVPPNGCLLVSGTNNLLGIWGFGHGRSGPWSDVVAIETSEPGTVRIGLGPFTTFSVFNGRSFAMIEGTGIGLSTHLGRVLRKVFPPDDFIETQAIARESLAIVNLARMIVDDSHGGTVLIVPGEEGDWQNSISSFAYRFASPDSTIKDLIRAELKNQVAFGDSIKRVLAAELPDDIKGLITGMMGTCPIDIQGAVRAVASLAGVDGAIVLTRDLRVLGFGAKIAVINDPSPRVCMFRPEPGTQDVVLSPLEDLGGTRHQSAARFVAVNRDAVALVISQDRHLSVANWDKQIDSVAVVRNAEWLT